MNIDGLIDGILDSYDTYGLINRSETENFPNRENVVNVLSDLQSLVFPGFRKAEEISPTNLRYVTGLKVNSIIATLTKEIEKALVFTMSCKKVTSTIRRRISLDVKALLAGDPAAKSDEEIILSYPGLEAILVHRIAYFLFKNGVPIIPRIMSEHVHGKTGIYLHP